MALGDAYVSVQEIKNHTEIPDTAEDTELDAVRSAVSRLVERWCGRTFNGAGSATARVFEPLDYDLVIVDDFSTNTGLVVEHDSLLDDTYATAITSANYTLSPRNNVVDGQTGHPYRIIKTTNGYTFTVSEGRPTVRITARWGWTAVPADVKQACLLECARVFRRKYTPDGLLAETSAGVAGYAVRVPTELDRTSQTLLAPYRVSSALAG